MKRRYPEWHPTQVVLAAALLAIGCSGAYRYCIRLPVALDHSGIEAEQCDRQCKRGHTDEDHGYLRCLAVCPGAEVTQNDTCGPNDDRPGMVCRATDMEVNESYGLAMRSDPGLTVAKAIGGVALGALAVAADLGGKKRESTGSSSSSTRPGAGTHSSETRKSSPSQGSRKAAAPRKGD